MDALERLDLLAQEVGMGVIEAKCEVDQVYAQDQHETLDFKHPHGGRAKYLEAPLYENYAELMQTVADSLLTTEGSDIRRGMRDVAEKMSSFVGDNAPVEYDVLRESGHPTVTDNGEVVYDRAPKAPRVKKQ